MRDQIKMRTNERDEGNDVLCVAPPDQCAMFGTYLAVAREETNNAISVTCVCCALKVRRHTLNTENNENLWKRMVNNGNNETRTCAKVNTISVHWQRLGERLTNTTCVGATQCNLNFMAGKKLNRNFSDLEREHRLLVLLES